MKTRHLRQILAVLLTFAMILGSTMVVAADNTVVETEPASGSTSGVGDMEGVVKTEVFKVSVPVTSVSNDDLTFVLDPQTLIKETGAARYGWGTNDYDADATLYFLSENSLSTGDKKYGNTSNALSVNNLSSVSVDVAITVDVKDAEGIALNDTDEFEGDDPAMYMALKTWIGKSDDYLSSPFLKGKAFDDTAITESTTSENMLKLIPKESGKYEYNWDADEEEYTYTLSSNYVEGTQDDSALYFWFEGASNSNNADKWLDLKDAAPSLDVVWNVKAHADAYLSVTSLSSPSNTVKAKLPSGVTVSSLKLTNRAGGKADVNMASGTHYTVDNGIYTITPSIVSNEVGAKIVFTFSDGTTETVTIG